jgi:hypothetical protein
MRNQGWNKNGLGRFREICKEVSEDRENNKVVDERYMESELEESKGNQSKKRNQENVIPARETGWDIADEDGMSVVEEGSVSQTS